MVDVCEIMLINKLLLFSLLNKLSYCSFYHRHCSSKFYIQPSSVVNVAVHNIGFQKYEPAAVKTLSVDIPASHQVILCSQFVADYVDYNARFPME